MQGNSAGRNASVLDPGRSVAIHSMLREGGTGIAGVKRRKCDLQNLGWNQRSAANVILCRCYTGYSLARPLEALCSRVPGSAETCLHGGSHCGNPRFMAQLAQSQRNLNTVIPGGIEHQEFPVCISDLGARLPTRSCFFMDESGGDRLNSAENLGARRKVETGVAFPGPDSGQSPSNERATEAESSFSDSPSRWSPPSK